MTYLDFEKEAEEYTKFVKFTKERWNCHKIFYADIELAYLKGAEKANEWHFVSKEGHSTKDDIYLTIKKDGLHLGDYCCGGDGDIDCQSWCDYPSEEEIQDDSIIAWKEIELPIK